jgi:hypothetical protein
MTVGEFTSDIKNSVRALTKDDRVSSRYIHSLSKGYTNYVLAQRNLSDILRDVSIFTEIPCVEMVRVKSDICDIAEFRKCDKVMKSHCKLPELYNSTIGPLIVSVTNMTGDVEYDRLRTPADYTNAKKRKFQTSSQYFYIQNDYLYLVNSTNERVSITGLFSDELDAKKFSACDDSIGECESVLDYKIIIPNKYISTVRDQVVQHLLKSFKVIPVDELPNLDTNQKSQQQ